MILLACGFFWVVFGVVCFISYLLRSKKPITTASYFRDFTDDEIAIADDVERHL